MASFVYHSAKEYIANGAIDLDNDTLKVALLGSGHTPDQANDANYADVSADEISGSGYTAGGATLSGVTVTRSGATVKLDATDPEWTALAPDFRYAVLYDDTHASDTLIALLDPGALQSPSGQNARVVFDANGILTLTDA
jgi:hypothetical protein